MKKVNFFVMAAFVAVSSMFISCNKDEDAQVTITLDKTELEATEALTGKIISTNALKQVTLLLGGSTVSGWPKDKFSTGEPINGTAGNYTIRIEGLAAGSYTIRATDGDGVEDNKTFTVKVAAKVAGEINTFAGIKMGCMAHNATDGSSCASIDGNVYKLAEAKTNAAKIDFIYFNGASNPFAISAPSNTDVQTLANNAVASWSVKNATKFAKLTITAAEFDAMKDDAVIAEKVTAAAVAADIVKDLKAGDVVGFITAGGKKGLIKVISLVTPQATGSITVGIKVQK